MKIDINSDVGEGIANEHLLMPNISSCNIACGGHFGDSNSIAETVELAIKNNVKIGAHPSFPDSENFGRIAMDISDHELIESLQSQLELFLSVAKKYDVKLHHIKPHGALYNSISKDKKLATVFLEAVQKYLKDAFLYVPYNSVIAGLAISKNIKIKYEVFADRNYNNDYSLVSRTQSNALLKNKEAVLNHVLLMFNNKVKTYNNLYLSIQADTFCVHGDTESAHVILEYLTSELVKKGIYLDK